MGDDEQVEVVAVLAPPPQPRQVDGVTVYGVHLVEPATPAIRDLRDLARNLHSKAQADLRGLLDRAAELGNGDYHLDRMYADAEAARLSAL